MNLEHYPYLVNSNYLEYEFMSSGPRGEIKKIVRFTLVTGNVFNLGFGDIDHTKGGINDIAVSDNNDKSKILATVASIVYDFTIKNKNALIFAQGSTTSRTRLYRIGIATHWLTISKDFEVFGLLKNTWMPFENNQNYTAFMVRRLQ